MQPLSPTKTTDVLAFEPIHAEPLQVWYAVADTACGVVTSIARRWPEGTGWCRRCPVEKCNAEGGVCLLVVRRFVPESEAAGFGLSGRLEPPDVDVLGRLGLPPADRDL